MSYSVTGQEFMELIKCKTVSALGSFHIMDVLPYKCSHEFYLSLFFFFPLQILFPLLVGTLKIPGNILPAHAYRHMCTCCVLTHVRDLTQWPKEQGGRKDAIPFPYAASQQPQSVRSFKAKWEEK